MRFVRRAAILALVLALSIALPSAAPAQVQPDRAMLRIVHAAADAPPVDVFVDNVQAFGAVPYRRITPYDTLDAGSHTVRVVQASTLEPVIFEATVDLGTNTYNSIALVGQGSDVEALPLLDSSCLPPVDTASIRFVNVSPDAASLDVALIGSPVLFQAPAALLFEDVPAGGQTAYRTVSVGTYDLELREAGTNNVVLRLPGLVLGGAKVYTVYAVGLVGLQPPLQALLAIDSPPPRR